MIIVRLLGGLGNQMFQYALGRRLAYDFGTSLAVDTCVLEDRVSSGHLVPRNFALDIFNAEISRATVLESLKYSAWGIPRYLRPVVRALGLSDENRQTRERFFGYDADVLRSGADVYLAGLWQSVEYFSPIEAILREDFRFKSPLLNEAIDLAAEISDVQSVCLHVRRTDYVVHKNSNSALGFVGLDYYRNGVQRILDQFNDARFFVFSDDLDWCRSELTFVPRVKFVPAEYAGYKDSTHLQLMSKCRVFLIPNSTFSWWAAWLSDNSQKSVFLPETWFRDESSDASGLYPEGWTRLQVVDLSCQRRN